MLGRILHALPLLPLFVVLTSLPLQANAIRYLLTETYQGTNFYDKFDWFSIPDWSHGRVNYTDRETSKRLNLTYATANTFILRGDYKTVLTADGPGRNSVRIRSKRAFKNHVAVFNVRHMPEGCGTWPAIWETKESGWPSGGELDILEGANNQAPNLVSVHTSANCTMPQVRNHTGTPVSLNCYNGGCNVRLPTQNSYGAPFNAIGGGWYAMERQADFIKVWFWPRTSTTVPATVKTPTNGEVFTEHWGTPSALFNSESCDLAAKFAENNIIINLNFCGDWAGSSYPYSGCPETCKAFVEKNTAYFSNAYFDIESIKVYLAG
ncbi:glycoside hydrolase family 16 protein [Coprinopsis sp. MPI-PUGE-AT-0042]|nr:glycoside hydrolase family 16 protein [Coprinopsis sp. MPI-PUGE-AT-0042]